MLSLLRREHLRVHSDLNSAKTEEVIYDSNINTGYENYPVFFVVEKVVLAIYNVNIIHKSPKLKIFNVCWRFIEGKVHI